MALKPLMSRAWSCSSLTNGLAAVYAHRDALAGTTLNDDDDMASQLKVSCHRHRFT